MFPLADGVIERVADTVTPQPVLAVVPMLAESAPEGGEWRAWPGTLVVVLVDVRDPGNAGTVLRTADASGVTAVVFAGESVDPYNPKTVRASAGSLFHVPFAVWPEPLALVDEMAAAGFRTLASEVRGGSDYTARRLVGAHRTVPRQRVRRARSGGVRGCLRIPGHPHDRSCRVAQRGRGLCRRLLRGVPPAPGRRVRAA